VRGCRGHHNSDVGVSMQLLNVGAVDVVSPCSSDVRGRVAILVDNAAAAAC
jgi:hypothetical protein